MYDESGPVNDLTFGHRTVDVIKDEKVEPDPPEEYVKEEPQIDNFDSEDLCSVENDSVNASSNTAVTEDDEKVADDPYQGRLRARRQR